MSVANFGFDAFDFLPAAATVPAAVVAVSGATSEMQLSDDLAVDVLSQLIRVVQGSPTGIRLTMLSGFTGDLADNSLVFYFSKAEPGGDGAGDYSLTSDISDEVVVESSGVAVAIMKVSNDTLIDAAGDAIDDEWNVSAYIESLTGATTCVASAMVKIVDTAKPLDND